MSTAQLDSDLLQKEKQPRRASARKSYAEASEGTTNYFVDWSQVWPHAVLLITLVIDRVLVFKKKEKTQQLRMLRGCIPLQTQLNIDEQRTPPNLLKRKSAEWRTMGPTPCMVWVFSVGWWRWTLSQVWQRQSCMELDSIPYGNAGWAGSCRRTSWSHEYIKTWNIRMVIDALVEALTYWWEYFFFYG